MSKRNFKKSNNETSFLLFSLSVILCFSCEVSIQNLNQKNEPKIVSVESPKNSVSQISNIASASNLKPTNFECRDEILLVKFKEISLKCDSSLMDALEVWENPATPLEQERDTPYGTRSKHLFFKLKGKYLRNYEKYSFSPRVEIYPISEFREAFVKSDSYVEQFDEEILSVKKIIASKTSQIKNLPFIPFVGMRVSLTTKVKHISFKNGQGVLHLSQFSAAESLINNEGLTYIFQGITADKKYYILATFPVRLDLLPDTYEEKVFRNYELPEFFQGSKNWEIHQAGYDKYLKSMKILLNQQKSDDFKPNLDKIEKMINSLEVNWSE
jgi:hypothetical protein